MPGSTSFAARLAAFVLAAGALLSACQVEVVETRPLPPPGERGFCTREYSPVCARRGSRYRTFGNACAAREAGFRIVSAGECGGYGGGGGGVVVERECPRALDPVCARRGGDVRTFANDCRADEAGFRVIYGGECRGSGGGVEIGKPETVLHGRISAGMRATRLAAADVSQPVRGRKPGLSGDLRRALLGVLPRAPRTE